MSTQDKQPTRFFNPAGAGALIGAPATPPLYNLGDAVPEPATKIEHTLIERGKRYGDFTDHAVICQGIKAAMRATGNGTCPTNWADLTDVQKQALEVIADKIARILSGDPEYKDNWHDIQGYAKLAEDRCKE
jgi:hypothetical protein